MGIPGLPEHPHVLLLTPALPQPVEEPDHLHVRLPLHHRQLQVHQVAPGPGRRLEREPAAKTGYVDVSKTGYFGVLKTGYFYPAKLFTDLLFLSPLVTGGSWRKSPVRMSWIPPKGRSFPFTALGRSPWQI